MPSALPVESPRPARGHEPVLLDEVVQMAAPRPGETIVDCTFGAGGHARRLAPAWGGRPLWPSTRIPRPSAWFSDLADDVVCEMRFVQANFADALPRLADQGLRADAILMDLGLSSMQVDRPERGFSYSRQAPLDMRMDPGLRRSAADSWPSPRARARRDLPRLRGGALRAADRPRHRAPPPPGAHRHHRRPGRGGALGASRRRPCSAGGHPAKRVFQALRIAVNDELGSLERASTAAFGLLRPAAAWR